MRTLVLPVGPPGAGKSTLCNGLQQFLTAVARTSSVVNIDPANDNIPYAAAVDVREIIDVDAVMDREELGPNGGVLWAMDELELAFDWMADRLDACPGDMVILDPPGQPELTIHHQALPRILHRLERERGFRIVVLQLLDSVVLTRPSLYLSSLLLCVRGMLHLPYPVVNVLTKVDNLKAVGGDALPFNLDFYTEVQDLTHLLPLLSAEQQGVRTATGNDGEQAPNRFEALNAALISLIEDFGLVGFETLAVEDRQSMASLLRAIDRASGYVLAGARGTDEAGRTLSDEASVWAQAMSEQWVGKMDVRDVQERWIDRRDEFDAIERRAWEDEARLAGALDASSAAAKVKRTAPQSTVPTKQEDADVMDEDDDDDLLEEQQRWQNERQETGEVGSAAAVRTA